MHLEVNSCTCYSVVFLATLVSFVVAALIMKFTKEPKQDLEAAAAQMETTKGKKSSVASKLYLLIKC